VTQYIAKHNPDKCVQCGACGEIVDCPGAEKLICLGCGACVLACPHEALELVEQTRMAEVCFEVDGKTARVPEQITVKDALAELGHPVAIMPEEPGIFAPCEVGGCGSCAVQIDGEVKLACRVEVKEGMQVKTELPADYVPTRIIEGFSGHQAGGVGTPAEVKGDKNFIEAVCFAAGCNFRCPQCQNWHVAYRGQGNALTPEQAAQSLTKVRSALSTNRLVISGGECTLNRPWLVRFIKELKTLNPDPEARFHVDTNGSILTHSYIDELVEAGMTDIGIDLKALEISTFMQITGLNNQVIAERYKETAWEAVRYVAQEYQGKVFVGVGIPYSRDMNSVTEISQMGKRLLDIDSSIQVTALNYRPAFRKQVLLPSDAEMEGVRQVLNGIGLKKVLAQTTAGFVGP